MIYCHFGVAPVNYSDSDLILIPFELKAAISERDNFFQPSYMYRWSIPLFDPVSSSTFQD